MYQFNITYFYDNFVLEATYYINTQIRISIIILIQSRLFTERNIDANIYISIL